MLNPFASSRDLKFVHHAFGIFDEGVGLFRLIFASTGQDQGQITRSHSELKEIRVCDTCFWAIFRFHGDDHLTSLDKVKSD